MLNETIELLTEQLIKEDFNNKEKVGKTIIVTDKIHLYKFCIKLIKLLKKFEKEYEI